MEYIRIHKISTTDTKKAAPAASNHSSTPCKPHVNKHPFPIITK